ncbi:EAL domain-containing protein [Photobacterium damselae]|uniref:EAL domain-containing protein n=1 Tax=Photobacterium damselae TaxID=38293 RepID=UPI00406955D6
MFMFYFQYQPKFYLNKIIGYEALLRGRLEHTELYPNEVLTKLNAEHDSNVDYLIIDNVINDLASKPHLKTTTVSINVSADFISTPINFSKINTKLIQDQNLSLEFEILEDSAITDFDICNQNIKLLNALNITVSLDDFGSDYCSLKRLTHLTGIDFIKIDKSFVDLALSDNRAMQTLLLVADIAHIYSSKILLEGIESVKSLAILKKLGFEYFQGFALGKPQTL